MLGQILILCLVERLMDGLEQVRATLGTEAQNGISDEKIKETLYNYWYDVQQTLDYLLGGHSIVGALVRILICPAEEQTRRRMALERKGELGLRDTFCPLCIPASYHLRHRHPVMFDG